MLEAISFVLIVMLGLIIYGILNFDEKKGKIALCLLVLFTIIFVILAVTAYKQFVLRNDQLFLEPGAEPVRIKMGMTYEFWHIRSILIDVAVKVIGVGCISSWAVKWFKQDKAKDGLFSEL